MTEELPTDMVVRSLGIPNKRTNPTIGTPSTQTRSVVSRNVGAVTPTYMEVPTTRHASSTGMRITARWRRSSLACQFSSMRLKDCVSILLRAITTWA